jgi:hypothetical protein
MPFDGAGFDPVIQTLRRAEDIILQRGWLQREYGRNGGPRCVIGAIREASLTVAMAWSLDPFNLGWDAGYCYGTAVGAEQIERWQDRPERTVAEVREGFRLAVERALETRGAA